jgi:hypothetical protein
MRDGKRMETWQLVVMAVIWTTVLTALALFTRGHAG